MCNINYYYFIIVFRYFLLSRMRAIKTKVSRAEPSCCISYTVALKKEERSSFGLDVFRSISFPPHSFYKRRYERHTYILFLYIYTHTYTHTHTYSTYPLKMHLLAAAFLTLVFFAVVATQRLHARPGLRSRYLRECGRCRSRVVPVFVIIALLLTRDARSFV